MTLTAPPGRFRELWASWRGLDAWSSLGDAERPEWQPFWLVTLANHDDPHSFDLRASDVHAHLLVGGVPWEDLDREVRAWSGVSQVKRVWHRWGILHYVFSQERNPFRHSLDVGSRCHALIGPPRESGNLEYLLQLTRHQVFAAAGRRGAFSRSAAWRTDRARRAARARWSRRPNRTTAP